MKKCLCFIQRKRPRKGKKSPLRSFKFHRKNVSRGTRLCKCLLQKGEPFGSSGINTCFSRRICFFLKRLVTFRRLSENNPRQLFIVTEVRSPYSVKLSLSLGKEVAIVLRILKMESAV